MKNNPFNKIKFKLPSFYCNINKIKIKSTSNSPEIFASKIFKYQCELSDLERPSKPISKLIE